MAYLFPVVKPYVPPKPDPQWDDAKRLQAIALYNEGKSVPEIIKTIWPDDNPSEGQRLVRQFIKEARSFK